MTMTKAQALALLKENQNERGIVHWKKLGSKAGKLKSFGIGLTQLRKLAKQIGRDHKLALQLWKTDVYDAKIIGLLIDDPKQVSREQAEEMWVREAMNTALMGIGKRNKTLNQAAIRAAKAIGPVNIDYGDDNSCEPLDVLKHLTSDYMKSKGF